VFRWKYTKDFSLAYGDDTVFLRMIEVTGTAFADSECTRCSAGFFSNRMGSSSCTPCAANTQAPNPGSSTCRDCGPNEYSFVGAARCVASSPCTESDVVSYYSSCFANNTRSKYYYYQTPKICSENLSGAYRKPADKYNEACAQCSPGWYRNSETHLCEGCPVNTFSPGNGEPCRPCESGHVGRRDFIWTNFEELPNPDVPAAMGCTGECGTDGWRLGNGHIDSGVGHGAYSDVFFSLNISVVSPSTVTFNISFACTRLCYLSYTDHNVGGTNSTSPVLLGTHTIYSFFFVNGNIYPQTVPISAGDHMITFHFSKFDGSSETINDLARIHGIQVRSVAAKQGGAATCQACTAGQYAASNTPYCQLTPPGTYSGDKAVSPSLCPANTFSEFSGSKVCLPCGAGTSAPRGSSWCDESCTYRLNDDINYDLKPLSRVGGDMYGPVVDPLSRRNFYLNICTREHTNVTCFNDDNLALSTQSCLTDAWGFGLDLGRVTNFYPHPSNPEMGVTIVYANSTADVQYPCRINTPQGRVTVPRTTNITFNCDPMAGFGSPEFVQEGSTICTFNFVWNSLFACSACDSTDWNYYYSDCVNGKQYKTYQWKENPRKCHGGLPLPAPEERACSVESQIPCPAGTYLLEECTPCPSGTFSLGGGRIINYWPYGAQLDPAFVASHPTNNFVSNQGPFLELRLPPAATISTTSVTATFNWVTTGSIEFLIGAITGNGYTLSLRTDLDFDTASPLTSRPSPSVLRIGEIPPGTHTFQFTMSKSQYASNDAVGWLRIFNVSTFGTSRAASQCTPALPGTYVYNPSRTPALCPVNTFQEQGRKTSCNPVPSGTWAPAGSERHYDVMACGWPDYDVIPTGSCIDGRMDVELRPKPFTTCVSPLDTRYRIPCGCAPGTYADSSGNCKTCPPGQGWDANQRRCAGAPAGYAAIGVFSFVKGRTSLPPQSPPSSSSSSSSSSAVSLLKRDADAAWYTQCSGTCTRPWTLTAHNTLGPVLESGLQVGYSTSTLNVIVPMANSGKLTVTYSRIGGANTQFQILVDGVVVHTDAVSHSSNSVSFPLARGGSRTITLAQFANEEIISNGVTRVSELLVTGSAIGGATISRCPAGTFSPGNANSCSPCRPGTFSNEEGASSCQTCANGTYTAYFGSTSCKTCPSGTKSNTQLGHSVCEAACQLTNGDSSYDWRDLPTVTARLTAEQRRLGYPDLQVSLCSSIVDGCRGEDGRMNGAFSCGTDPLDTDNTAHQLNFGTYLASTRFNPTTHRIELEYAGGDRCLAPGSVNRTSKVTLQCPGHNAASQAAPVFENYGNCHAELVWYTSSACRACEQSDYKKVLGECVKRKQTITYLLVSEDCHHSDFTQPESTEQACSQIGLSIGLVVGIGIAIMLLVASVVIFCMRHRKLTTEYRLLKEAHDGGFEDNETQFGVDDDDEGVTLDQIHIDDDDDDGLRLPTSQTSDPHDEL
jgi:hypothetical protein